MKNIESNLQVNEVELEFKSWGITQCIYIDRQYSLHRIKVEPGGYSSIHYHENKFNGFYVESGCLIIRLFDDPNKLEHYQSIKLHVGNSCIIDADQVHQFICFDNVIAYEFYKSSDQRLILDRFDIVRLSDNGKLTQHELNNVNRF